jgi:hypothetical protein
MPVSIDDIAKQMLVLLPDDGTPVLNRVMRVMLARALSEGIAEDAYASARAKLLGEERIGLKPGQGGQVFLRAKPASLPSRKQSKSESDGWSESDLMPWLKKYLSGPLQQQLGVLRGGQCLVYDTSAVGKHGANWARPDFTLICARHFKFLPGIEFDVHSFELKAESGGATDLAVYEALAQTRFTNFGHLVWHLPGGSKFEKKLPALERQCGQHGIGFIRARDPRKFDTWEILLEPQPKRTPSSEVDQFLDERLKEDQRKQIRNLLNGSAA